MPKQRSRLAGQATASVEFEKIRTRKLFDDFRSYIASSPPHSVPGLATPTHLPAALQEPSATDQLLQDLHGYSLVALLAAFIETRLMLFCTALRDGRSLPSGVDDLEGSFVERVRGYLRLHLGACPPRELWRWVDDVIRTR